MLRTFRKARTDLGEILSSCEFMDAGSMDTVVGNLGLKNPIAESRFYLLIETSGSKSEHDEEKLSQFLDGVMGEGLVADGTVASSQTQIDQLWPLRERMAEALMKDGYTYKVVQLDFTLKPTLIFLVTSDNVNTFHFWRKIHLDPSWLV